MYFLKTGFSCPVFLLFAIACMQVHCTGNHFRQKDKGRSYHLSTNGDDTGSGNKDQPWKTLGKLNMLQLQAGDTVYLEGGQVFKGTLRLDSGDSGHKDNFVVLTSHGTGEAVIDAGNGPAIVIENARYLSVQNLKLKGAGRKEGNQENGLVVRNSEHILVDSMNISGFQKAGLLIQASSNVKATRVYAKGNGFAGISVSGSNAKKDCRDIYIGYCTAENNPGDPSNLNNHSGNGIVAGYCRNVTIEYCVATNNGWDMPRKGNGPVGIWAYEADSVVIQHCISYRNKTSPGAEDGGGFDFDGGVTNSVLQYCLSYENHGSGFAIFQYSGASPWYNNTYRYNISENDGNVSSAGAGVYVWNNSGDKEQLTNCLFYNNVIYNSEGAAISYARDSERKDFRFYNNIFVSKDELVKGGPGNDIFRANNWWSLAGGPEGLKRPEQPEDLSENPGFKSPGHTTVTIPSKLEAYNNYQIPKSSVLRHKGIDLKQHYGIETGGIGFNQNPAPSLGIGACF